jgi:hypothetical protein
LKRVEKHGGVISEGLCLERLEMPEFNMSQNGKRENSRDIFLNASASSTYFLGMNKAGKGNS